MTASKALANIAGKRKPTGEEAAAFADRGGAPPPAAGPAQVSTPDGGSVARPAAPSLPPSPEPASVAAPAATAMVVRERQKPGPKSRAGEGGVRSTFRVTERHMALANQIRANAMLKFGKKVEIADVVRAALELLQQRLPHEQLDLVVRLIDEKQPWNE